MNCEAAHGNNQTLATDLWEQARLELRFPRDIERAILRTLPIGIIRLPRLDTDSANLFLAQRNLVIFIAELHSRLHACLIAYKGVGLMMIDGLDSDAEQRFSIAHETAHFILHYLKPRQRAECRLGPAVLDVLDGVRPPSEPERIDAVLTGVRIGVHSHLLPNEDFGLTDWEFETVELGADGLALELLAPRTEVLSRLRAMPDPQGHKDRMNLTLRVLTRDFGLPTAIAKATARLYEGVWRRPFSIREWLD